MHTEPLLRNDGVAGRGPLLAPGSVLAIEPMLTLGSGKTDPVKPSCLTTKWAVTTVDGLRAAHWKHSVAVTEDGPRILPLG
jgi:methionyl aminopeptidase